MTLPLASLGRAADALAQDIDRLHGPVTLVRRCADLVELLDASPEHTATVVDALREAGAAVAVVVGAEDAGRWRGMGVVEVPSTAPPREAARLLEEAGRQPPGPAGGALWGGAAAPVSAPGSSGLPGSPGSPAAGPGDSVGAAGAPDGAGSSAGGLPPLTAPDPDDETSSLEAVVGLPRGEQQDAPPAPPPPRGRLVAVWGPHGSPGRSTVAVNLAAECAELGAAVTVVDLDTWGPSVAALLGLLDEAAGVALACRAADRDRLTREALDRAAVEVAVGGSRITVLTGLTRPERWPELRAGSVRRLLSACLHMPRSGAAGGRPDPPRRVGRRDAPPPAPVTVVDVGFCLEEDEELSFDSGAPRRNAAALTALAEADLVVAVCSADVLGVPRAARELTALHGVTEAPVMVVANRVRRSAAGHAPRAALRESWQAVGAPGAIDVFLPWDPRVVDAAALDGSVLAESAPGSALRRELQGLARRVLDRLDGAGDAAHEQVTPEVLRGSRLSRRTSGWLRR